MIKQEDLLIARELKDRINSKIPTIDFRVFGSRARGVYEEGSDLDIYIVVDKPVREVKQMVRESAWEVGLRHFVVISTLIFSEYEITRTALRSSPIVRNIQREGVVV